MPDILDENGLQISTLTELITNLTNDLKAIYGNDIIVTSNSPDGQTINIFCQASVDLREVLQKVYSSFDPDQAEGRVLDQRVSINGIKRKEGSFTLQVVRLVIDRALNLVGLDDKETEINPNIQNLYTVKDNAGTLFYLLDSQIIAGAGTYDFTFRAADLGRIEVIPNTITTAVTVIAGITSINNPSAVSTLGQNEETDIELKVRRRYSVAIPSKGYIDSIQSSLANLSNVTSVSVYENYTNVTDANGIPPHCIWVIIEGGSSTEIAEVIYAKKPPGTNMKGSQTVVIVPENNIDYIIRYDIPIDQDLYIRFLVTPSLTGSEETSLKAYIVASLFWVIGSSASSDIIYSFLKDYLGEDYKITDVELSLNGSSWDEIVDVTSLQHKFLNDTTRITIL